MERLFSRVILPTDRILKKTSISFLKEKSSQAQVLNQRINLRKHQKKVKKKLLLRNLIQLNASRKSMNSKLKLAQLFKRTTRSKELPRTCQDASVSWFTRMLMIHPLKNQPLTGKISVSSSENRKPLIHAKKSSRNM